MSMRCAICDSTGVVVNVVLSNPDDTPPKGYELILITPETNNAEIGGKYNKTFGKFIGIQPFNSWVLDETSCCWVPPIPLPDDGGAYYWDEYNLTWGKS